MVSGCCDCWLLRHTSAAHSWCSGMSSHQPLLPHSAARAAAERGEGKSAVAGSSAAVERTCRNTLPALRAMRRVTRQGRASRSRHDTR